MSHCLTKTIRSAAMIGLIWLTVGCNRGAKHQLTAISRFDQGTPLEAIEAFDDAAEVRGAEHEIIAADRAIAMLMSGDSAACETALRKTREEMDFLRQRDVRERTVAVITDDKAIAWSGREFERRMVDNLLILSSLVGDRQDAFAYANQAMEHVYDDQSALRGPTTTGQAIKSVGYSEPPSTVPTPPARYSPNALSAYLHAAIRSENPMDRDLAINAIRQVSFWNQARAASTAAEQQDAESAFGTMSEQGQGVLHVVTLVGRVTDWTQERSMPTTLALLIADQILSAVGDHSLPPTVAPVLIARPASELSGHPLVTAAGMADAPSQQGIVSKTLVDLNAAAFDSYMADRDEQLARAVARRVIKKGAIYAAKDQLSVSGGSGADLLLSLGGIAWEATEKADTRHLQLLPERIEILQMKLPAGVHQIDLWSTPRSQKALTSAQRAIRVPVTIDDGRNTFIVCFRPHSDFVGSVLTSDGNLEVSVP